MSDEITPVEELPVEDQKKAINLQDLVYVKKYIDDYHYDKEETDAMIDSKVAEAVEDKVNDTCYNKDETYNKSETYSKTETDETFYKKTDTVDNATKVQNVNFSDDNVAKIGDYIISKKKLIWNSDIPLVFLDQGSAAYWHDLGVDMNSVSTEFINLIEANCKYKLIGCARRIEGTEYIDAGVDFEFECDFNTVQKNGTCISVSSSSVFMIPFITYDTSKSTGDAIPTFYLNGIITRDSSGNLKLSESDITISLLSGGGSASYSLRDDELNYYTFNITRLYKIVE